MNATAIATDELRTNLTDYLGRVAYAGEVFAITRYGQNAAYLVSPEVMQMLLDPSKRLSKKDRQAAFKRMDRVLAKVPASDPTETEALVEKAVAEVRSERKQRKAKA